MRDPDPGLHRGIELFNRGGYFEAHEALEAVWLGAPRIDRFFLQSLIHMAVAWHHAVHANRPGALKQVDKGLRKLAGYLPVWQGIDTRRLYLDAQTWRAHWQEGYNRREDMRAWAAIVTVAISFAQPPPKLKDITAVCGDQEILEFGLECSLDEPCPVFLELSSVEVVGAKVFLTGNLHTPTTTISTLLLASEDEGKTWIEPAARIRGAALDQIQFIDFENGWASGNVSGSLPKDPFLLKTTDGGKTWRRVVLFEDTFYGSIDQFWFDSKTHGLMVLNRKGARGVPFQKMETMTGGDSWMTREVSPKAVPPIRPKTAGNTDWRIRTDTASKTFRLERRQDGRWSQVYAFPVTAGVCKPDPPRPVQPPGDTPPADAVKPKEPPRQ
ncbi:DUF309 domain-containing protein [uncultured Paludibaculum sp.]|uniref:DUF309 domain-containing protein n=1 Tax=uncultured Paludibaculum sp. TaxID=1765020 RepID=UPI002AAADEB3|nr:DUF309 domain-containing protein [uncultured Paludibaculum sp.]